MLYSLSNFISLTLLCYLMLRSQSRLRPVGTHVLRPSLLSDNRMDSTFGEVHLSSTAPLFAQWATDGVSQKFFCASLLSVIYSSLQPEYCRFDCFADNPVAVTFCVCVCVCLTLVCSLPAWPALLPSPFLSHPNSQKKTRFTVIIWWRTVIRYAFGIKPHLPPTQ